MNTGFPQLVSAGLEAFLHSDSHADNSRVLLFAQAQQKAEVVGVGIAVEKGFQEGGKKLREAGIHLKSLAIVDGIEDGKIILRPDED